MSIPLAVRVGSAVLAGGAGIGLENIGTGHALHESLGNAFPAGADSQFVMAGLDISFDEADSGGFRMKSG